MLTSRRGAFYFVRRTSMSILAAFILGAFGLLALDLLTAPKHVPTAPRANLKGRRPA